MRSLTAHGSVNKACNAANIMRHLFHLAAALLLFGAATTRAQITNPDNLVARPPRPPTHHAATPAEDLQWLWQYTKPAPSGDELALLQDPRFPILLRDYLNAPQSFWRNGNVPLYEAAQQHFGVTQGGVQADGNRYVVLRGCVQHNCADQGLLWIDTLPRHALLIFAATDWTTQGDPMESANANFNLWIFPSRPIDLEHPPASFVQAIEHWNATAPQHIQRAIVVDPNGASHPVDPTALGATPSTN